MKQTRLFSISAGMLLLAASGFARTQSLTVSVRGSVAEDYQRVKLANGTYKPERYVLSNGGLFPGTTRDSSIEKVPYPEVAGIVARHLAAQQYYLAQKSKDADLLIAIYWGATIPFNDSNYNQAVDALSQAVNVQSAQSPLRNLAGQGSGSAPAANALTDGGSLEFLLARLQMENLQRDVLNTNNAQLLGYMDAINNRREMLPWADIGAVEHDLMADVEEERYYVVVRAYDFKALQRDGKQVVRWTTRISIGAQGTGFDERVAQMVAAAANAFGQQQGLKRRFYGDPRVDLGETKYLGEASLPAAAAGERKK